MNYRLSGLGLSEIDARQICFLLEKLTPEPLGCGFTEIDNTKDLWEVDAYFNYKPNLSIKFILEELFTKTPNYCL